MNDDNDDELFCSVCVPGAGRPRTTDDAVSAGVCRICGNPVDVA